MSTGASSDFEHALDLVERMIFSGMTRLGVVRAESLPKETLHQVSTEVVQRLQRQTEEIIRTNQDRLRRIATILMQRERLTGEELRELLGLPRLSLADAADAVM